MAKLVFGCGYLGLRVARAWRESGQEVWAVTRRPTKAVELKRLGIRPVLGDVTESLRLPEMAPLETVLFAVGHDRTAGKPVYEVYVHGLQQALAALPESVQCFIYISSTGVYGQSSGEWVDENSPCQPTRAGGIACLTAERLLEAHALGRWAIILRLAGLYGPGRIPKVEAVRAGRPLPVSAHGYLNLIHVDDATRIVLTAEQKAVPPCRYVVADGHPVARRDFYAEAARLLSAPPPQFEDPSHDSSAAQRAATSKRVRSARMAQELGVVLQYGSYRDGLRAIFAPG